MDRHTFSWASRVARHRRAGSNSALRRCHDELSVIVDHVAALRGIDGSEVGPPIRR